MLGGNLATRPFYNQRAVMFAMALAGLVVIVLSAFNVSEIARLTADRRRFRDQIQRDQTQAARIHRSTSTSLQSIDRVMLARLTNATRQANDLIDQRTFSWTSFFVVIERTLPADVRLVEVSPRVEQGTFRVTMTIVARSLSDVGTFVDALRSSGAFHTVAAIDQQTREDGAFGATVEAEYVPASSAVATRTAGSAR